MLSQCAPLVVHTAALPVAMGAPAPPFSQLPALGAPGKVVSRTAIAGLDMEQVTFANGARLLLFPNDAEANRVCVNVRFGGGYNALPADKQTPAWAADRSEEHTSELQSLMRLSYAVFCLQQKTGTQQ